MRLLLLLTRSSEAIGPELGKSMSGRVLRLSSGAEDVGASTRCVGGDSVTCVLPGVADMSAGNFSSGRVFLRSGGSGAATTGVAGGVGDVAARLFVEGVGCCCFSAKSCGTSNSGLVFLLWGGIGAATAGVTGGVGDVAARLFVAGEGACGFGALGATSNSGRVFLLSGGSGAKTGIPGVVGGEDGADGWHAEGVGTATSTDTSTSLRDFRLSRRHGFTETTGVQPADSAGRLVAGVSCCCCATSEPTSNNGLVRLLSGSETGTIGEEATDEASSPSGLGSPASGTLWSTRFLRRSGAIGTTTTEDDAEDGVAGISIWAASPRDPAALVPKSGARPRRRRDLLGGGAVGSTPGSSVLRGASLFTGEKAAATGAPWSNTFRRGPCTVSSEAADRNPVDIGILTDLGACSVTVVDDLRPLVPSQTSQQRSRLPSSF